jgi:hypothetical protein
MDIMRNRLRCAAGAALIVATAAAFPAEPFLDPSPYRSFDDSPFKGLSFSYFYLEDFEPLTASKPARAPGFTATTGGVILGPGLQTDSVDADDGAIDNSGIGGSSWFSNQGTTIFTFTFDAGVLGTLPTHAGIVWTDVGDAFSGSDFTSGVLFEAFGPGGESLGQLGPELLGDGNANGGTAEDRFFGAVHAAGISAIAISTPASFDWEVDHLQYGAINPIPEPEQWLLMALGIGAVAWRLRSRVRSS